MSQSTFAIANQSRTSYRGAVNTALQALASVSSGATAPSETYAYMLWADTTNGVLKQRNAANGGWITRGTLAETRLLARSSNTILALGNFACTIIATSTFTQTFPAASTLGDGWFCYYRNDGTGVITLDPDGAELIDGLTTVALQAGESCIIFCNGSAFKTVGLSKSPYFTNSLGADVDLNNTANYFTGPIVSQGTSGTWFVTGTVTVTDGVAAQFRAKLWDGTTVIASAQTTLLGNGYTTISLSGVIANPVGDLRISIKDGSNVTGKILYNVTGETHDSTLSAIRIA